MLQIKGDITLSGKLTTKVLGRLNRFKGACAVLFFGELESDGQNNINLKNCTLNIDKEMLGKILKAIEEDEQR